MSYKTCSHQQPDADWLICTLCRSHRRSLEVLDRAKRRKVEWPKPKPCNNNPIEGPVDYTSIDDAFASVMQFMGRTTRQCKRFYRSTPQSQTDSKDCDHCSRFHTPQYTRAHHRNPLQSAEDVHLVVHPGTYAVTAGEWGTARQQTHVVHVDNGRTVNLDFVL